MPHFPINLDLDGRRCVVIGGGVVAERKVKTLLEFGAAVYVVSPLLTDGLQSLVSDGKIDYIPKAYSPGMLNGACLVIAATDDMDANKAVFGEAQELGIPVNVVDDPDLCSFYMPAVVRRGDFIISVSTSGKSPSLARRVRERLESTFGPEYGELADLLGELREEVKARYQDPVDRQQAFLRILDSTVIDLLAEGRPEEAIERARECIL